MHLENSAVATGLEKVSFHSDLKERQCQRMFKLNLEKADDSDQIANICWIIEKAREFQKNIYFWFIDYAKAFDYVGHNKLENF